MQDYLTAKKDEKVLAAVEPPIKEVGELKLALAEPTSMARSETNSDRVASSPRLYRVGSSPRSDANPLNRIGSSPRLVDSPRSSGHYSAPQTQQDSQQGSRLVNATVKNIVSVGEGDRVSVDLCNLLNPGEALLVSYKLHDDDPKPDSDQVFVLTVFARCCRFLFTKLRCLHVVPGGFLFEGYVPRACRGSRQQYKPTFLSC